jgi:DNA-binding PadR family transcriptional regulator
MGKGGGRGFRAARMLASGDLQLIVLALLAEKPRHGYEIIKALEEHSSGIYTPSPGVVYPALTYLDEMGYAVSEASGNKKLYAITEAGQKHLTENRPLVDETLEQLARFGRKMARVQQHFADEEAEHDFDASDARTTGKREWRRMKEEFRELTHELKAALWEKIDASTAEKARVLEILRNALAAIRKQTSKETPPETGPADKA